MQGSQVLKSPKPERSGSIANQLAKQAGDKWSKYVPVRKSMQHNPLTSQNLKSELDNNYESVFKKAIDSIKESRCKPSSSSSTSENRKSISPLSRSPLQKQSNASKSNSSHSAAVNRLRKANDSKLNQSIDSNYPHSNESSISMTNSIKSQATSYKNTKTAATGGAGCSSNSFTSQGNKLMNKSTDEELNNSMSKSITTSISNKRQSICSHSYKGDTMLKENIDSSLNNTINRDLEEEDLIQPEPPAKPIEKDVLDPQSPPLDSKSGYESNQSIQHQAIATSKVNNTKIKQKTSGNSSAIRNKSNQKENISNALSTSANNISKLNYSPLKRNSKPNIKKPTSATSKSTTLTLNKSQNYSSSKTATNRSTTPKSSTSVNSKKNCDSTSETHSRMSHTSHQSVPLTSSFSSALNKMIKPDYNALTTESDVTETITSQLQLSTSNISQTMKKARSTTPNLKEKRNSQFNNSNHSATSATPNTRKGSNLSKSPKPTAATKKSPISKDPATQQQLSKLENDSKKNKERLAAKGNKLAEKLLSHDKNQKKTKRKDLSPNTRPTSQFTTSTTPAKSPATKKRKSIANDGGSSNISRDPISSKRYSCQITPSARGVAGDYSSNLEEPHQIDQVSRFYHEGEDPRFTLTKLGIGKLIELWIDKSIGHKRLAFIKLLTIMHQDSIKIRGFLIRQEMRIVLQYFSQWKTTIQKRNVFKISPGYGKSSSDGMCISERQLQQQVKSRNKKKATMHLRFKLLSKYFDQLAAIQRTSRRQRNKRQDELSYRGGNTAIGNNSTSNDTQQSSKVIIYSTDKRQVSDSSHSRLTNSCSYQANGEIENIVIPGGLDTAEFDKGDFAKNGEKNQKLAVASGYDLELSSSNTKKQPFTELTDRSPEMFQCSNLDHSFGCENNVQSEQFTPNKKNGTLNDGTSQTEKGETNYALQSVLADLSHSLTNMEDNQHNIEEHYPDQIQTSIPKPIEKEYSPQKPFQQKKNKENTYQGSGKKNQTPQRVFAMGPRTKSESLIKNQENCLSSAKKQISQTTAKKPSTRMSVPSETSINRNPSLEQLKRRESASRAAALTNQPQNIVTNKTTKQISYRKGSITSTEKETMSHRNSIASPNIQRDVEVTNLHQGLVEIETNENTYAFSLNKALTYYQLKLLRKYGFYPLKEIVDKRKKQMTEAIELRKTVLMRNAFNGFLTSDIPDLMDSYSYQTVSDKLMYYQQEHSYSSSHNSSQQYEDMDFLDQEMETKAITHYQTIQKINVFNALLKNFINSFEENAAYDSIRQDYLKRSCFSNWFLIINELKEEKDDLDDAYSTIVEQFRFIMLADKCFKSFRQVLQGKKRTQQAKPSKRGVKTYGSTTTSTQNHPQKSSYRSGFRCKKRKLFDIKITINEAFQYRASFR